METEASKTDGFPSPDPKKPYVYPGSDVLINKFGIRSHRVLERVTRTLSRIRGEMLSREPIGGAFGFDHYRAIHRYLFQDVFDWAGEVRIVSINRKESRYVLARQISAEAAVIFGNLQAESCLKELSRAEFIERAAHFYAEINRLHPFREGNGRTQRRFFEQLATDAGHPVDFDKQTRKALHAVCGSTDFGDLEPMRRFFDAIAS